MQKLSAIIGSLLLLILCGFAADWVNFENKEGGFKIQMPRQPEASNQEINAEKGDIQMKLFMCDQSKYKDDNELYLVGYVDELDPSINSDMEDEQVDDLLHTAIKGGSDDMAGKIISENVVMLKGYRGREAKIRVVEKNYAVRMRAYLVHGRLYLLEVACEALKDDNAAMKKFLSSFDISADPKTVHVKTESNNWATLQQDKFKVAMPELPEEEVTDVNSEIGALKMHSFTYQTGKYKDDNEVYQLIYTDYPADMVNSDFKDALIDTFFSNAIKGMVKKNSVKKLSEQKISHKTYPGRSVKIAMTEQEAVINSKMYLVHNRLYILQTICYKKNDNNASSTKFFNSFELTGDK